MTNPKALLDHFGVIPKKSLGQNFLHDPQALEKIADAAELMPEDTVLEIGPGTGALTAVLAQRVRRVVAVELDRRLEPIMRLTLAPYGNVEVIFDDILNVNLPELLGDQPYVVVANVPYYITSAIIRLLLERVPLSKPNRADWYVAGSDAGVLPPGRSPSTPTT